MKKENIQKILEDLLTTGGDFAEVFYEEKKSKSFVYVDNLLDELKTSYRQGVGLRLAKDKQMFYAATNDLNKTNLTKVILDLKNNLNSPIIYSKVSLNRLKKYQPKIEECYSDKEIKEKLENINKIIRSKCSKINQVKIMFLENWQKVTIANHTGLYVQELRPLARIYIEVFFKDGSKDADVYFSKGLNDAKVLLDSLDFNKIADDLIQSGLAKLKAVPCAGKVMPVIIGPGFGGVIFHEACGHAMEATSVADGLSVLTGALNQKIASAKVTIIDDGTIPGEWGTTIIDDEGAKTQKNILIENGVLKNYLIDELNNRKMHLKPTGSSRRESYCYAPTSRMNNTYLAPGTDTFSDMVKSIKLGLYAKSLGGGCVSTETGEFNFACTEAYMIRDGKIAEAVKSASLIGNTKEILKEVEMVGPNMELGPGMCGSLSGYVPVNVGEPFIKVGHILVGGEEE